MTAEERLAAASAAWPGREAQLTQLVALLGRPRDAAACVTVSGPPGSGKTGCVRAALGAAGHRAAYASCLECHAPRLLFETLLAQLAPRAAAPAWHPVRGWAGARPRGQQARAAPRPAPQRVTRCTSLADFIDALRAAAPRDGRATYLVVDEAQRIVERRWGAGGSLSAATAGGAARGSAAAAGAHDLLGALLRLDELTGRNYGVVLVSCAPWASFRDSTGTRDPLPLLFPPYDSAALQAILCAEPPPAGAADAGADAALWRSFVGSMMGVFGASCRSLHELRALLAPLWRRYTKPLAGLRASGRTPDARTLFTLLAAGPRVAASVAVADRTSALHASLAVPLSAPALALAEEEIWPIPAPPGGGSGGVGGWGGAAPAGVAAPGAPPGRLDFDLPALSKFLLLAAFLAARTPAGADAVAFADGADAAAGAAAAARDAPAEGDFGDAPQAKGKRKRGGGASGGGGAAKAAARAAAAAQEKALRGPGVFSLERMLAIFRTIQLHTEQDAEEDAPRGTPRRGGRGAAGAGADSDGDEEEEEEEEEEETPARLRATGRDATPRRLASSSPFASPRSAGKGGAAAVSPPASTPRGATAKAKGKAPAAAQQQQQQQQPGGAVFDGPLVSDVFAQVASLCELGLLSRASADPLELPRFRCAVSEPLARRLAANAGVPLERYLQHRPV